MYDKLIVTGFTGSARGQFGSISEAYADILGETVQLLLNKPVEYTSRQPSRACTPAEETTNRRWIALDYLSDPEINIWKVNANQEKIGNFKRHKMILELVSKGLECGCIFRSVN
jgi:hypothetical protein